MGILIFITLMMALEMTFAMTPSPVGTRQDDTDYSSQEVLAQIAELKQIESRLNAELTQKVLQARERLNQARAQSDPRVPAPDPSVTGFPQKVQEAMAQFKQKLEALKTLAEEVKEKSDPKKLQEEKDKLQVLLSRNEELDKQIKLAEQSLQEAQMNPRMSYILQGAGSKQPLIMEVSGKRVLIGTPNDSDRTISIPTSSADSATINQVLSSFDRNKVYIVLVVKPSGFSKARELSGLITDAGFGIGRDMVEESHKVLIEPE
jgi:hypothetical protein